MPAMSEGVSRYLRPRDAAKYLGLSVQTLAQWRVSGSPVPWRRLGRAVLYDRLELDAALSMGFASTADADRREQIVAGLSRIAQKR
jgi:hypothetical protein